jgi:hypothetical protein
MADAKLIDILEVGDPKLEGGMIELPVDAKSEGHHGRMRLRFSVEAAQNMSARLTALIPMAKAHRK